MFVVEINLITLDIVNLINIYRVREVDCDEFIDWLFEFGISN